MTRSSPRWKTVIATILRSQEIAPQSTMVQKEDRLFFGPKNALSVAGRRYQLSAAYTVDGIRYDISFPMICDEIPTTLTLAYDPAQPGSWDWPEDRTLEEELV